MRNIFASSSFDDIILREYADLQEDYRFIYKKVAGLEAIGVKVHRQFLIRSAGIEADQVSRYIHDLDDIIEEYSVDTRQGVYGWRVRHRVIAEIVAHWKYSGEQELYDLIDAAIEQINPTYQIELMSLNEMCDRSRGFSRVTDKRRQNILLSKMISKAPSQRIPRHRLIRNLIDLGEWESAQTEIRVFENDLGVDGPVYRYKVDLLIERARRAAGLLDEDRAAMAREAAAIAEAGVSRFRDDRNQLKSFYDAAITLLRYARDRSVYDAAKAVATRAYARVPDPEIARLISRYEALEANF
jgi:hypothetical protein